MERLSKYSIPFAGLAIGSHQFEYEIDDAFFESFNNSVIEKAKVKVDLDFNKSESVLTLTFHIYGSVRLTCDRCTEEFDFPVDTNQTMLVRFSEVPTGETDDIIVISYGEHQINIAQHLYDYLCLLIPMKVVHPDDENGNSTCNPEFLSAISGQAEEREQESDPRWEALKGLSSRKN